MANISVTVQDGNNITLVTTPTPTQVITIDRGIAGPAGPAGVPAGSQYQIQYNSGVSTFAASPNLTFNGSNLVLQSASSTTAFRITQTGTGNAFVVEDSASTDATPFVISASGDVGIGTTTPSSELHIARGDATSYDGAATDGQLAAGSTVFVQQTAGTNTGVSQIVFQSRITFPYNRIVSSGGSAPFMTFVTNNAERMRISSAGNVGIGTTTPTEKLTVTGNAAISGTITEAGIPVVVQTDIGTAPNEIPLNQYLGELAYMNSESLVITPPASVTPNGIGDMVFQLTNNTTLVIKVKGSDGTVRSASLTLA